MGYNISPLLFFIEICNNDKDNKKEYFRIFSEKTQQPYWMGAVSHRWTALGERIKRSFLDMSVLPLDGDQEEEDRLETH